MDMRSVSLAGVALFAIAAATLGGMAVVSFSGSSGGFPADPTPNVVAVSTSTPAARTISTDVCTTTFDFDEPGEQVFDSFYATTRDVLGLTIVAGPKVSSAAVDTAEVTIRRVFANNDHDERLAELGAYVIVAEPAQGVLDLPEFSCLEGELGEDFFTHVCGIADKASYPVVTVNTLDLLGDMHGPCRGVNILYHELGHMVHNFAADPPDHIESRLLYNDAMQAGLYEGRYAATNYREYFAEGTQAFFDAQDRSGRRNSSWLEGYDPALFELLERVYGR